MWVEVECSIGESLACVKGRNSKPPSGRTWECKSGLYRYSQFGMCLSAYAYTIGLELEMLQMHLLQKSITVAM